MGGAPEAAGGLSAEGLGKRYGDLWALRELDLDVPAGSVLGLLGHNGAGKTTAVRILTTLAQPTTGSARVAGFDVVTQAPLVRARIGLAAQAATVDGLAAATLGLVVMTASGLIVGWRIHTDPPHAAAGFALLLLFASAMIWLGTLIGVITRTPDAMQGVAFMTVFPLTFLANAFVPADGLPDGLRQVAEYNPVSALVAATRTLFGNPTALPGDAPWPLQHPVSAALLWSLALLAISVPLCVRRFQARTSD